MSPLWSRRPRRRELTSGRRTTPRTSLLRTSRRSRTGEIPGEPTPALEEEEQRRNSGLGTLRRLTSAAPERENPVRAMRKTSLQGRKMFRKCQRTHCNTIPVWTRGLMASSLWAAAPDLYILLGSVTSQSSEMLKYQISLQEVMLSVTVRQLSRAASAQRRMRRQCDWDWVPHCGSEATTDCTDTVTEISRHNIVFITSEITVFMTYGKYRQYRNNVCNNKVKQCWDRSKSPNNKNFYNMVGTERFSLLIARWL